MALETVGLVLKSTIDEYKSIHTKFSSQQIAKKFNIPVSTFHRLENNTAQNPGFENAIKVLVGTGKESMIPEFLRKFNPEMAEIYESVYKNNENIDVAFAPVETEEYFSDPNTFQMMILTTAECGTSLNEIKEEFGKNGLEKAKELINKSILVEKENGRVLFNKDTNYLNFSQKTVKKLLAMSTEKCYHLDNFMTKGKANWASHMTESVNKGKVLPQLVKIMRRTDKEIYEVLNNPENRGKDTVWAGLVCDEWLKSSDVVEDNSGEVLQ